MPGGCDRVLRSLNTVHRGCTSELCGFRQRRAAAQELESTTQEEDLKVVEHLGGKAVYERHSCRQNLCWIL
jgi:hypothetical protein